jgi:dolichol-phosphate mannosyltransferase
MSGAPWVVVPTYNEAENLEPLMRALLGALATAAPDGHHVLIVDDSSPDGTGEIADRLAEEHDEIEVLHRTTKEGLGPAYIAGFGRALAGGAGYVIEMDADFSHDPADVGRLLAAAQDGADLVLGSRYVAAGAVVNWGKLRRVVSRGGSWYARRVLGLSVSDLTGGFKCFRAEALRTIGIDHVRSRGYAFQVELTYRAARAGLRIVEVPITFRDRERGDSKMSGRIALEAAWRVPQLRLRRR